MLKKMLLFLCCILFCATAQTQNSQKNSEETIKKDSSKLKILAIPVLFYTPDTKLGFGGGGIATWQSPNARYPNSLTFSLVYTLRKQILAWFPFQYYAPYNRWQTYGEIGYYKYIFEYFGKGNSIPNDYVEKYTAQFPRLRISALKQIKQGQNVGIRLAFDDYRLVQVDSSDQALLYQSGLTGAIGGRVAGAGLIWLTDTRDQRFYPKKGWFVEYLAYTEGKYTGSDYAYQQFSLNAAHYVTLGKTNTLAINVVATATVGDAPFNQLPIIGGTKLLRGYKLGKYRDDNMLVLQGEWRKEVWKRFGATIFGGAGAVWGTAEEKAKLRPNYGLGLRYTLDTKQHLNIRADYGFGSKGNSGFYLTIGEAF